MRLILLQESMRLLYFLLECIKKEKQRAGEARIDNEKINIEGSGEGLRGYVESQERDGKSGREGEKDRKREKGGKRRRERGGEEREREGGGESRE